MTTAETIRIALEAPDRDDVIALIAELDAYQHSLYPAESVYALDLSVVARQCLLFAVARTMDGNAVGCCAVVLDDTSGDLKRMYVRPGHRGLGIAHKLLVLLESHATTAGCLLLQLETGPLQHEALALYTRCGYQRRGPYGSYADDPLSVFMEKALVA